MRVAIAQLNQVIGDLSGNAARILEAATFARRGGAQLLITPELSLCGYPPEDLLLRPAFLAACADELARLAVVSKASPWWSAFPELASNVRATRRRAARRQGRSGVSQALSAKLHRFDEQRYFSAGGDPHCRRRRHSSRHHYLRRRLVLGPPPRRATLARKIVVPNGSPYHTASGSSGAQWSPKHARPACRSFTQSHRGRDGSYSTAPFIVDGAGGGAAASGVA
jgi:hypothetical protein